MPPIELSLANGHRSRQNGRRDLRYSTSRRRTTKPDFFFGLPGKGTAQIAVKMCVQRRLACCVPGMSDSLEVKVLCSVMEAKC